MQKVRFEYIFIPLILAVAFVISVFVFSDVERKTYKIESFSVAKEYDGEAVNPVVKVTPTSAYTIKYKKSTETNYTNQAPIDAGKYNAQITIESDGEYEKLVKEYSFEITKRPLYIGGFEIENKVYDGQTQAQINGEVELTNIVNDDDVSFQGQLEANFITSEIGEQIEVSFDGITLTGADKDNYVIVYPKLAANIVDSSNLYTINYVATRGGTVQGNTSQQVIKGGSTQSVTAVPDANYYFDSWSDGIKSATRYDTNIVSSFNITAIFKPIVDEKELDLFIIAGQSNSVCYTGDNSSSLDVLSQPDYPENIFEYRPRQNNIQKLANPVGEGVSSAGFSQGYTTGGTWFSSMAKAYNEETCRSVVILPAGNPGVSTSTYYSGGGNFNMLMEKYNSFKNWINSQTEYKLGRTVLVWHQGESGTGDSRTMKDATKKVFDDITSAIQSSNPEHPIDQVFFSRISNNEACNAATTKNYNEQFAQLNEETDYVLVAPNALQYYWLDQFADEHHYDMNACNDLGDKIGSDIAYYFLNDGEKPNSTTYEQTQSMNFGSKYLQGLNITSDTLIAFDDTIDKSRYWLLANDTYSSYATFSNININYTTNFELEFTLKLGDDLTNVSAGSTYPVLGSADGSSSISVGSNSAVLKAGSETLTLSHNVSPMIYRPRSERICKEINHISYKIIKQGNNISLYVQNGADAAFVLKNSATCSTSFNMSLNYFGRSGSTYLQGVVSNFNLVIN